MSKAYTAAGTGKASFRDNTGEKAAFNSPTGLAVDDEGTVYIADTGNNVIRCMDEDGKVITYAGGKEGCALPKMEHREMKTACRTLFSVQNAAGGFKSTPGPGRGEDRHIPHLFCTKFWPPK